MQVSRANKTILGPILQRYAQQYEYQFRDLLSRVTQNEDVFAPRLELKQPEPVRQFVERLRTIQQLIARMPEYGGELDDSHAPYIREALVRERFAVAERVESHKSRTIDPELTAQIGTQLEPYSQVMREAWFRDAPALAVPQPQEYFPLNFFDRAEEPNEVPRRMLDEKFRILQAPALFLYDLANARLAGQLRGVACAVGYIDVDDFKSVNTEFGEPVVDLNILPRLMRALEAHTFQRGFAYRYGGDEYVVLLHNTSPDEAARYFSALRSRVEELRFLGTRVDFKVTVSIGFLVVDPNCHLTGLEVEDAAARAKQHAKGAGKNRVASFNDRWFESLYAFV